MTRPATLVLLGAVLACAGTALTSRALFAVGCGIAFAAIAAVVSVLGGARTVRVSRRVPSHEVEEGGALSLFVSSRRSRLWPVRVEVFAGNEWRPVGSVEVAVEVRIGARGAHELSPTPMRVTDSLGIAVRSIAASTRAEVLALPRPNPAQLASARRLDANGDAEPSELRPYVPGTQLSRIHWRSLARRGELMQRETSQAPTEATPLVVVDTYGAHNREAVDRVARTAAAAVLRLAPNRGCRVVLPGDRVPVHIASDLQRWPDLLRRLALLEAASTPPSHRRGDGARVVWIAARDQRTADTGPVRAPAGEQPPGR